MYVLEIIWLVIKNWVLLLPAYIISVQCSNISFVLMISHYFYLSVLLPFLLLLLFFPQVLNLIHFLFSNIRQVFPPSGCMLISTCILKNVYCLYILRTTRAGYKVPGTLFLTPLEPFASLPKWRPTWSHPDPFPHYTWLDFSAWVPI